jgi:hypothetical protein
VVSTTPKEREPSTRAPHEEVDTVSRHPWGRDSSFRPLGQGPMNGPGEGARRSAPQGGAHRSALPGTPLPCPRVSLASPRPVFDKDLGGGAGRQFRDPTELVLPT